MATSERKAAKSKNKNGDPIKLGSKILAIEADVENDGVVYVAEAAGLIRKIVIDVSIACSFLVVNIEHTPTFATVLSYLQNTN